VKTSILPDSNPNLRIQDLDAKLPAAFASATNRTIHGTQSSDGCDARIEIQPVSESPVFESVEAHPDIADSDRCARAVSARYLDRHWTHVQVQSRGQ
jgi:hypothetical protein